jgi:hypothetical protein
MWKQKGVFAVEPPAATDKARARCKLVYILGAGHCGSTLLSRLLGEVPGFFNVGEAGRHLFAQETAGAQKSPCGCGQSAGECDFWSEIVSGVSPQVRAYWKWARRSRFLKFRAFIPALQMQLSRSLQDERQPRSELAEVASSMAATYERIGKKANGKIVVDSSKDGVMAVLLATTPSIELYVIQLTRHPYGVVSSYGSPKTGARAVSMPECILTKCWYDYLRFELVKRRAYWYRTLLYEDLVKNPTAVLNGLAEQITGTRVELSFMRAKAAALGLQHDLEGNPRVPSWGRLEIRQGEGQLCAWKRYAIWLTTFPLLWRYGYFSRRA